MRTIFFTSVEVRGTHLAIVQVLFHDVFYTTNSDGQHCSKFLDSDEPILTNKRICTITFSLGEG